MSQPACRHGTAERVELATLRRIATAGIVVIGMIWIPIMQVLSKQLYSYLQLVQSLLAPSIAAVFMAVKYTAVNFAMQRYTPRSVWYAVIRHMKRTTIFVPESLQRTFVVLTTH
jgi:SSS family solute:Na+ symporter